MSKHPVIRAIILVFFGQLIAAATFGADIYRSIQADGTIRYASAPLDSSYSLYLKGDTETASIVKVAPASFKRRDTKAAALQSLIRQLAQKHAVEPALVQAIVDVESHSDPGAVSAKGAVGMMQLMPATAARYGVTNSTDPAQNLEAGIRHLKHLLILHQGNIPLALASYNSGEGAVARHGQRIPPFRETMLYVPAVLARLHAARNADFK